MNTQRLEKVLKKMETEGLEQMIISDPYAIYYLTGRFIDQGGRLLALYINQSGKNKIFINNLFYRSGRSGRREIPFLGYRRLPDSSVRLC